VSGSVRPRQSGATRFVGREAELASLDALFEVSRIVTVVGPAGIGKTRLALEWGRAQSERSGIACELVDLSMARGIEDILREAAETLGGASAGTDRGAQLDALAEAVGNRGALALVFDNTEGCRPGLALCLDALRELDDVRILVTSRARMGIEEERVLALEGLAGDLGAELFVDRAQHVRPGVSGEDPAVVELVRALEGVPLALELAAARSLMLSPAELLARVRESALDTLVRTVGADDSMRARYAWSFSLLSPEEMRALTEISVIHGSFTIAEAEAVVDVRGPKPAGQKLALIEALREHHLLRATEARLGLYAGVRELAEERGDAEVRAAAFERWTTYLTERAARALTDESDAALFELKALEPHARDALFAFIARGCAHPDDPRRAATLYSAVTRLRRMHGPLQDVIATGETLSGLVASHPSALALVSANLGMCVADADTARAEVLLTNACELAARTGEVAIEALAKVHLGIVLVRRNEPVRVQAMVEEMRLTARDPATLARVAHVAAALAMMKGDIVLADLEIGAALVHARRAASSSLRGRAEVLAALISLDLGRLDSAGEHAAEAVACCASIEDRTGGCLARIFLAEIHLYEGRTAEALAGFHAAVVDSSRLGAGAIAAYAMTCRGMAHLLDSHLALAEADLADGAEAFERYEERTSGALAVAARACVAALRGHVELARAHADRAEVVDAESAGVRALLEVARSLMGGAAGSVPPAADVAGSRKGPRIGVFVASRIRAGVLAPPALSRVSMRDDGFVVDGQVAVTLATKPRLLALFRALASAHEASADAFVSRAELIERTWPGERMRDDAAMNRLKVSLSSLRKLGLPLDSTPEGVRIAAGAVVERI
jgi:predicted ATPase